MNRAAVFQILPLLDKPAGVESRQQTGNVWIGMKHTVSDLRTAQPVLASLAKNTQHVVLGSGNLVVPERLLHGAGEKHRRALQIYKRLFFNAQTRICRQDLLLSLFSHDGVETRREFNLPGSGYR